MAAHTAPAGWINVEDRYPADACGTCRAGFYADDQIWDGSPARLNIRRVGDPRAKTHIERRTRTKLGLSMSDAILYHGGRATYCGREIGG